MLDPLPRNASLVTQTVLALRDALERGELGGTLPSERQLCERLRVSRPTVRAALAQLVQERRIAVSQGKSSRVLRQKTGRDVTACRRLVMLSPVPAGRLPPFTTFWFDELRDRLGIEGVSLELCVQPNAFTQRPARVLESLTRQNPDAIWLIYLTIESVQRWFHERSLPCVVAGTCVPGITLPYVDIDYRAACRHAAGTLINAGRNRLALLLPEGARGGESESEVGFLEASSSSFAMSRRPQIVRHDTTVAGVCRAVDSLLQQDPPVNGLVVARSIHALTVLTHLLHRRVCVPADLALISRDDDAYLEHTVPAVARYVSHPVKFAKQLARLVLQLTAGVSTHLRPQLLIPELVRGDTIRSG